MNRRGTSKGEGTIGWALIVSSCAGGEEKKKLVLRSHLKTQNRQQSRPGIYTGFEQDIRQRDETARRRSTGNGRPTVRDLIRISDRILTEINDGTPEWEKIANEAARTIPGRENGGNCDIKNLSRGSKIYLPVFVEGANLSTGDMHFSQGDGEVSFCGAIEMSGFLELKCEIIRGGMKEYLTPMGPTELHVNPIFEIGPVEPRFSEWLVFEGISVDESGRQHFMDATLAYKRAVLNAIDYLSKFGYSKEQAYLLLSCCPCEGRISGIVDTPNAVATIAIPIAIFDQDIRPKPQRSLGGPRIVKKLPDVFRCSYDGDLPITPNLSKAKEN